MLEGFKVGELGMAKRMEGQSFALVGGKNGFG